MKPDFSLPIDSIGRRLLPTLFYILSFLNAFVLFALQPAVAKTLLPSFGGAPAVWNTCLVFFQGSLLLGYLGAYLLDKIPSTGLCSAGYVLLLVSSALLFSGFDVTHLSPTDISNEPARTLLILLVSSVLFQAILLSSGSPVFQALFKRVSKNDAAVYGLYGASNLGSFCGLLAYPLFFEVYFTTTQQLGFLKISLGGLAVIGSLVAIIVIQATGRDVPPRAEARAREFSIYWLLIPAITSGLLISISTAISTDIAPIPLLWIVPLSIFLLSYVVAFKDRLPGPARSGYLVRIFTCVTLFCWLADLNEPMWLVTPIYLITFALLCFTSHLKLYQLRPPPSS